MALHFRMRFVSAAILVITVLSAGVASGGPVTDCNTRPDPGQGSTELATLGASHVTTSGGDIRYHSAVSYFYIGTDGAYGRRYGSSYGEPANAFAFDVSGSSVCVAVPAAGVGIQVP
jgi:hypothetical protein